MLYAIVTYFLACLVDLLTAKWMSEDEKDTEIALLRQQLRIVERRQERGPHIPRWQKVPLAVLADRLKERSQQAKEKLAATILLFRPATVIKWHRAAVRRKWTFQQKRKPGRPRVDPKLEYWIVRLAKEDPGLGYDKVGRRTGQAGLYRQSQYGEECDDPEWSSSGSRARRTWHLMARLRHPLQRPDPCLRFLHR